MAEATATADLVFADQIRALNDNLVARNIANVVTAAFMSVALLEAHSPLIVALWFVGNVVVHVLRVVSLHIIRERARGAPDEVKRLARGFSVWLVIVSVYWGGTALLLVSPPHRNVQTAMAFCLGGLCAGGISANAYHLPVLYTRLAIVMLPLAIRMLALGDPYHTYLGAGLLLLSFYLVGYGREAWETSQRVFSLRNENLVLVERLRQEREEAVRSREVAEAANAAKSRLFAAASHDLSQPLQALGLWAGMLTDGRGAASPEAVGRHITSSVSALSELFDGVLELSRIDAGHLEVRASSFSVAPLIDRMAATFGGPALEKDIVLRCRARDLWLHADPIILHRIVSNLVSNAVRYTTRGRVVVGAKCDGNAVRIVVADTGPGIPEASMPHLFDEFYRVPGSKGRGFGLGLASVRRLADVAGYPLEVRSRVGHGTIFTITVPRGEPAGVMATDVTEDAGLDASLRVLVVEDDDEARSALVATLDGWGIRSVASSSAEEALAIFEHATPPFQVVVTDHDLAHDENGLDLLARLRARRGGDLGGIVISGTMTSALEERVRAVGGVPLRKPVSPLRLRASLSYAARSQVRR